MNDTRAESVRPVRSEQKVSMAPMRTGEYISGSRLGLPKSNPSMTTAGPTLYAMPCTVRISLHSSHTWSLSRPLISPVSQSSTGSLWSAPPRYSSVKKFSRGTVNRAHPVTLPGSMPITCRLSGGNGLHTFVTGGGTALTRCSNKRTTDLLYDLSQCYRVATAVIAGAYPPWQVISVLESLIMLGAPQNPSGLHASPVLAAYIGSPAEAGLAAVS